MDKKWNAQMWLDDFTKASRNRSSYDLHGLRSIVYRNTMNCVKNESYVSCSGNIVSLPRDNDMIANTKFYHEEFTTNAPVLPDNTEVKVKDADTLVVAKMLLDEGLNPAALNLASRRNPGGGVINGAGAQEESLFRRTNLFLSMYQFADYAEQYGLKRSPYQYPMDRNYGGIYTPKATVFRGTEVEGSPLLDEPFKVDFIAVAAINHPDLDSNGLLTPIMVEATKKKMRTIFRIALDNGNDSLVLGALGCGAFANPPAHIARLFHEVMAEDEFRNRFKKIYFAIFDDHNSKRKHNPEGNFLPFKREFA